MGRPLNPRILEVVRKDGTTVYRVRVRLPSKQTTETFTSKAAARVFRENVIEFGAEEAVAMRDHDDPNSSAYIPTLKEMLEKHTNELTGVDKRTRDDYLAVARRSWLPTLGGYPVNKVTRAHLARWVNAEDGTKSPKTIKNAHSVLSATLEAAVDAGHIERNPARKMRLPRSGEHEVEENRYLTHKEYDLLLRTVPEHYKAFVMLLFATGLRFSEATALQVRDLDSVNGTVRVMRAWKREKGAVRIGPPKSKMSRRTIAVAPEVVNAVRPLLDRPGDSWLFVTATGRPILHSNFYNRIWKPACVSAGLSPRPRIHDARHTHASWMIAQGARLEVVQERLGHEDYTTTRRVYAHLTPDLQAEARRAARAIFTGRPELEA